MTIRLLITVLILSTVSCFAQTRTKVYKTKNGPDITKNIPFNEKYQFEKFQPGIVYFKNGRKVTASMNYNLFHGEVLFIGPNRDTLLLTDNNYIDSIQIGSEVFYYIRANGHVQEIGDFQRIKLAQKQILSVMDNEREGAFNHYSATSAISNYSTFGNKNGEMQWLKPADKVVFKKNSLYYFVDRNFKFYPANKVSLLKIFRYHSKELNEYFRQNRIDFLNRNELVRTLQFCETL